MLVGGVPRSVKALHRRLSSRAVHLLDRCEVDPRLLEPWQYRDDQMPEWMRAFPFPLQSWPTFVASDKLQELRRAAVEVARLVKGVPYRVLDGDPERIGGYFGISPAVAAAIFSEPDGLDAGLARGDFIDTEHGLKCVEMNLDACLGGWQIRFFLDRFLGRPWVADLVDQRPRARYVNPLYELFGHVTSRAIEDSVADAGEVNVAFLVPTDSALLRMSGSSDYLAREYRSFREGREPYLGGDLFLGAYGDTASSDGRIYMDGRRIHVVVDYQQPKPHTTLFRSFKAGHVHYYNGPAGQVLRDKRTLALLSEHVATGRYDAAERKVIESHVPWTRVARPGITDFHGDRVDLLSFVLSNREQLVIKPATGIGGMSVSIGSSLPAEAWNEVVRQAFSGGGWLVQERQESVPYWYQHDGFGACAHDLIWGLFAFGPRYGGGFLRMMPRGGDGVINASRGATEGFLLEIEPRATAS